jgi:VWFA-related protein
MPHGQWVAVYGLDQRLYLTQPFTRNREALKNAIERATAAAGESRDQLGVSQADSDPVQRAADAAVKVFATERPSGDTAAIGAAVSELRVMEVIARMARMVETADLQQRSQSTLFPLMALMKAQGTLAGRKALLLFSEGIPIPPSLEEAYRSAISEANRANVSIYAVDARGLNIGRALDQSRQMLDRSARNRRDELRDRRKCAARGHAERTRRLVGRDERRPDRQHERTWLSSVRTRDIRSRQLL